MIQFINILRGSNNNMTYKFYFVLLLLLYKSIILTISRDKNNDCLQRLVIEFIQLSE